MPVEHGRKRDLKEGVVVFFEETSEELIVKSAQPSFPIPNITNRCGGGEGSGNDPTTYTKMTVHCN